MSHRNHDTTATAAHAGWRRSSYSGEANLCLATIALGVGVGVRDSKVADGPVQTYSAPAWNAMIGELKRP